MSQFNVLLSHLMFISSSLSCCFIIEAICLHLNSIEYFSFHKSDEKLEQMCEVEDFGDTSDDTCDQNANKVEPNFS